MDEPVYLGTTAPEGLDVYPAKQYHNPVSRISYSIYETEASIIYGAKPAVGPTSYFEIENGELAELMRFIGVADPDLEI